MVVVSRTQTVILYRKVTMFLIFLEEEKLTRFFKKSYLPVFKLILSHPQLLLLLSIEVDLNIAVGNQWNKAVAEESYAESEKDK